MAEASTQGMTNLRASVINAFETVDQNIHGIDILARPRIPVRIETTIIVLKVQDRIYHSPNVGQWVILMIIDKELMISSVYRLHGRAKPIGAPKACGSIDGTIQPIKPQIQRRTRSGMLFHIAKIDQQLTDKENVIPLKPSLLPVSAHHPLFEVVLVTEFVCLEDGILELNRELLAKGQY